MPSTQFGTPRIKGWKYGKPAWQLVVDAVTTLGGRATKAQITRAILDVVPNFNVANVEPDLSRISVNSIARGNHSPNKKPRRTDQGNRYDLLYIDQSREYILYDSKKHGIWAMVKREHDDILRPELIQDAYLEKLLVVESDRANTEGTFDPQDETDARTKILASIVRRRGQKKFRDALLKAYQHRCAITGCDLVDALEAAHIKWYLGDQTNVVTNGLLLRADIHTLFDLGLIRISPDTMKIVVASRLMDSEYRTLAGVAIRLPSDPLQWPNKEALRLHGEGSSAF